MRKLLKRLPVFKKRQGDTAEGPVSPEHTATAATAAAVVAVDAPEASTTG